ncbi:3'-5' exoribonuclease YhaM family protein [Candidatus Bipolaricaulota bacterium]
MAPEKFSQKMRGEQLPYSLLHVPVSDIRDGQAVNQCFLVKQKTQRSTRAGDPYLEITLADRTGIIAGRAWADAANRYASEFSEGEFVFVQGRVESYRNKLQVVVESISRLSTHDQESGQLPGFDPSLLVSTSDRDIDEMWSELMELTASIEPEELRQLTLNLLESNRESFCEHPAAVANHHAYLGGLLEHTLEVAHGVSEFAIRNPGLGLHHGLATSGAILHDIGKIIELENPIAATYGFDGQLAGHLLLGRDMIRDAAQSLSWPDDRLPRLLEHILISHHGELEYAAAMVPKTPESIAVYHFDNLSAKLNMVRMHIRNDAEPGDFTDWERNLNRRIFKGLAE